MLRASENRLREIQKKRGSQFAFVDGFLGPKELDGLLTYVMRREREFRRARLGQYVLNPRIRRARVSSDLGWYRHLFRDRLLDYLPSVVAKLNINDFEISRVVTLLTASNDGDFFRRHTDASLEEKKTVTFVYYFYREPKAFTGGELRLYRTRRKDRRHIVADMAIFDTVAPQQNMMLFFPCFLLHEILPVRCPSRRFGDSRFTVNGWISA
jgi:SM-20-related protein